MCVFEILHFLPVALIAASILQLRSGSGAMAFAVIAVLSVAGLVGGQHSHVEHAAFFGMMDPCYAYAASLVVSVVGLAKAAYMRVARA